MGKGKTWAQAAATPTNTTNHQQSATIAINTTKYELEIATLIKRQFGLNVHAVVQINSESPYLYQITFKNPTDYLTALPQKLQVNNHTVILYPLGNVRIRISLMRVDPEIEDGRIDRIFEQYGKLVHNCSKQYKLVEGVGPVHTGTRVLSLELHDPSELPPNSIQLNPYGNPNLTLFTLPGSKVNNQEVAFNARCEKRDKIEQERIAREEERSDEIPPIVRPHDEIDDEIADRHGSESEIEPQDEQSIEASPPDHVVNNPESSSQSIESTESTAEGEPHSETTIGQFEPASPETPTESNAGEDDSSTCPPDPCTQTVLDCISNNDRSHTSRLVDAPKLNPYNRLQKLDLDQASIIAPGQEFPTEKCEACGLDLSPAVRHSDCFGPSDTPPSPLKPDRRCRYGGDALADAISSYKSSTKKSCDRIAYILSNCHPVYWKRALQSLELTSKLAPPALARIVTLAASTPDHTRTGRSTVLRSQIVSVTDQHPKLKAAIQDLKLLPRSEGNTMNTNQSTEMARTVLSACNNTLEKLES